MTVTDLDVPFARHHETGTVLDAMPFDTAALGDQVLIDPDANEERLGDRWRQDPQVVLFLRHFG